MADQGRSVFQPLETKDFVGPFGGWLRPPEQTQAQQQMQQQQAPVSTVGGIASAATAFLQGAAQGRIRKYEQQENEKISGWNQLNSYMQNSVIGNPNIDAEGQAAAQRVYAQTMGHFGPS